MKNVSTILLLSIFGLNAFGQTWTAGPKAAFGLTTSVRGDEVQIGNNAINLTTTTLSSPTQVGAFVRYDRPMWYGQVEGLFGKAETGMVRSATSLGSGSSFLIGKRADTRLLIGMKPLPWFRLYAGAGYARLNWSIQDYDSEIASADKAALERPELAQTWLARADFARFNKAVDQSYRRNIVTGLAGLGVDIHGVMIDLTYSQSVTPLIDGIMLNTSAYAARQQYQHVALSIGYKLFPLKAHLLAPRKNRAYERIKRDIPFYRNEVHVSGGLMNEDIGNAFIYENRYTRYLSRRFGLTAGLNLMNVYETFENGSLPNQYSRVQLVSGLRVLPLYSRRHTIGLSAGPTLTYKSGFRTFSGGGRIVDGQLLQTVNINADSRMNRLQVGIQAMLDYNFAATDRIIVGPWLRATPDYGSFGIQAGYRF